MASLNMACTRPLKGYKAPGGTISFTPRIGFTDLPSVTVKCGQCLGCRLEKKRGWAIRSVHEAQMHEQNSFLTLTYDKEHLPKDRSVNVRDWQLFAKKVRKEMGPFRFLHSGEYGEGNHRPHYHACIFGLDWHEDRKLHSQQAGYPLWTSGRLSKLWGNGFSTIGSLSFDSAAYVAGYCVKKATGQQAEATYKRWGSSYPENENDQWIVNPEYATMSRNPGLGHTWYQRYKTDVYPGDFVVQKGTKFRPPAYYDSLLEEDDPEMWADIQKKRQAIVRNSDDYQAEHRLKAKEEVLAAKMAMYANKKLD